MSALPEGFSLRPATIGDLDAVAEVLAAEDLEATGEVFYDTGFVRFQWTKPGVDLPNDAWVVEDSDGRAIAHALVTPDGDEVVASWGVVRPSHRGRGIGSVLLDRIERRGGERLAGGGRLQHSVSDTDRAGASMVSARGFRRVRTFRHMQIELDGTVPPAEPPPGIEIRSIEPDRDLRTVHAIFLETFRDQFGYRVIPFEVWLQIDVEDPSFDPSLWLLATEGSEPVAALSAANWGDRGWIGELGVRHAWRGRGIGSSLLRRSFAAFAERGRPRVMLNVDSENPTGAVGVYERVGMRAVRGWDVYEKTLPEA
jgi:mycothiol synthase